MDITSYLDPSLVLQLEGSSRDEVMRTLVTALEKEGKIDNGEEFLEALLNREKIVSTGIGMGIAIPHAKLPTYDDFFIAIGRLEKGVEWNSLDNAPVRLIFMIGGPDDKQNEYLQILSALTEKIKDEEQRKKILILQSPEEIIHLFRGNL